MNIDICPQKIPEYIMQDLRCRWGLDEDEESGDKSILTMTPYSFLDDLLGWDGIIGYTSRILEFIKMAYGINLEDEPFTSKIPERTKEN